jgi:acetolactate synthase I/II/III large subunit
MNGAEAIVDTLVRLGVRMCFANPGTSELHLVEAIAARSDVRTVLGCHENVCSGAADGYARFAGRPAMVLVHLGPGLANALSNIHNAVKAGSPMIVLVGDHPAAHRALDPPLASNIEAIAEGPGCWVRTIASPLQAAQAAADAFVATMAWPHRPAVLVIPNDVAWSDAPPLAVYPDLPAPKPVAASAITAARDALYARGATSGLYLGLDCLEDADARKAADAICAKTGARLLAPTFMRTLPRGEAAVAVERVPYFPRMATQVLGPLTDLILAGIDEPIGFFAYPGLGSYLAPPSVRRWPMGTAAENAAAALQSLADALETGTAARPLVARKTVVPPQGALTSAAIGSVLATYLPANAIVCDDGVSEGFSSWLTMENGPAHRWSFPIGGSIGNGMATAIGAALAEPSTPVITLQGDGSGLYGVQALWTQARENLSCLTIVFANHKYRILELEMMTLRGGNSGASPLFELAEPKIDWVALAAGFGVSATRSTSVAEFQDAFLEHVGKPKPFLIEAVL